MIDEKDLEKIANLARLSITEDEKKIYPKQLSQVMDYFEQISRINTEGVEPLVTPTDIVQHLRADKAVEWDGAEIAVSNAPEKSGHLLKVPPVV